MQLKHHNILVIVTSLFAATMCYSQSELLFPHNGKSEPAVVSPVDPDSSISDPHGVRDAAKAAAAGMSRQDALKVYGLVKAAADYVALHASDNGGTMTNADVGNTMDAALQLEGWTKGKYPAWNACVSEAQYDYKVTVDGKEVTLKTVLPLVQCRSEYGDMLRLLASGCRAAITEMK